MTVAANNRPALLVFFIDFLSAFDKMWYPALIANLLELEMPLPPVKWIHQWLQGRTMAIYHGDSISKNVEILHSKKKVIYRTPRNVLRCV